MLVIKIKSEKGGLVNIPQIDYENGMNTSNCSDSDQEPNEHSLKSFLSFMK